MKRDSFIFYRSWWESIKYLPENIQLEIFRAISSYAIDGEDVDFKEVTSRAMFGLVRPQIDTNNKRFANGCRGAESGKKGGRPRKQTPMGNPELDFESGQQETPKEPQENPNKTPNVICNMENVDNNKESKEKGEPSSPKRTFFQKPNIEEIESYVKDNNLNVDCQRFFDYYESCGWKIGNKPMKEWRAAARNWSRKENEEKGRGTAESNLYRNGKSYNESKF